MTWGSSNSVYFDWKKNSKKITETEFLSKYKDDPLNLL